ncbi:type I restriction-modification system endonuclease [Clostridium sp. JNZ J1-5]
MESNFQFLNDKWSILSELGSLAERNLYRDSNTSLIKLGMFGELIVKYIFAFEGIDEPNEDNTHVARIRILKKGELLPDEIDNILYMLRRKRNDAAHEGYESIEEAKELLNLAYKLGIWFMQVYGDWGFEPKEFIMPREEQTYKEFNEIAKDYEERLAKLQVELEELKEAQTQKEILERRKKSSIAAQSIEFTEAQTRNLIDAQLREAGWEADTKELRYSKGIRPEKGRNMAIAEWPTSSKEKTNGFVDYALFIGTKLAAVIEAKKSSKDVIGNMVESKIYAKGIKAEHNEYVISSWGEYKVPFLFVSNGRKYISEIKEKSGVHFLDCRKSTNHPKALHGWYSPEKLKDMLAQDLDKSNKKLEDLSFNLLINQEGVGLRYYQVEAIRAVEKAIIEGRKSALITMATGTGKTRTVLGLIYRLLYTQRFKRILFLVDRTALGIQAKETFDEVKIENLQTLNQIYNINSLEDKTMERETKVHIATVQAMVKRIMYSSENNIPSVGDYDCIIVDEAHRGYILDREMTDGEVEFRDNRDFVSKYKKVIEYFDAFKVGLTATPALHTTQIFGAPVYNYTYRNAVIDGYLVDHEPPHIIKTKLMEEGLHYNKGVVVPKYDNTTGEVINSEEIPDDLEFDIDDFNRKVIVESFNREVLREVAKYLSPDGEEKALIFASNDAHADIIVRLLKEIYDELLGGVDDDAIQKITGSIKDTDLAIKKFKNEKYPTIAVTVDLLTTGIDVPKITKLVFLRRVKSRILYEQMLGRATRLCEDINKTHFEIFDCVNIYEALSEVTNMKPVVVDKKEDFKTLIENLKRASSDEEKKNEMNKIIAKLQRKKKLIRNEEREIFKSLSENKTPDEFIEDLKRLSVEDGMKLIIERNSLIEYLDEKSISHSYTYVSKEEDVLVEHSRGYGNGKRPEDYLEEFKAFIEENKNKILALEIVCTKPKDLTRESLKGLKTVLDYNGFNEEYLRTAWKDLKDEDIAADIISFIRQQALGSALIPKEERVRGAVQKIRKEYNITPLQEPWLKRIEEFMIKEVIIDSEVFEIGNFKRQGGFNRFNKIFDGKLEQIIDDIKENMFNERGLA